MYEGIFKDVETVKELLASKGENSVDENLVFTLLEDYKSTDKVVTVLLGNRFRQSFTARNGALPKEVCVSEIDDFVFFSDNSYSSDELEILEDVGLDRVERPGQSRRNKDVESTMEENFVNSVGPPAGPENELEKSVTEISLAKESEKSDDEKSFKVSADSMSKSKDVDGNESKAVREPAKEEVYFYEDSREIFDEKSEDIDATNSATESEDVEMDDYYMRPDNDSGESVGDEWSVERRITTPTTLIPLSPILRMQDEMEATNFDICNNEESNLERAENRIEEIFEENNNDPNNNLEDIQVLEQNNVSSTIRENSSNLEKDRIVEDKCVSPKPGCSKDSYYADSDVCFVAGADKNNFPASSSKIDNRLTEVCDKASSSESRVTVGHASWELVDEKMSSDFIVIKKILPNADSETIRSCLIENRDAINRVELTLWDLLPDERPLPILSCKRKQEDENPSSMSKKMYIPIERSNSKTTSVQSNSGIIKPAKLSVPEGNKNIVNPQKSAFANYRSSLPQFNKGLKSTNSTLKLKPSALKFVSSRNGGEAGSSDSNRPKLSNNPRINYTPGIASNQEKSSVLQNSDELDPIVKKQARFSVQNLPPVIVKESRLKSESSNQKITGAIPKYQVQLKKPILVSKLGKEENVINQRIPKSSEAGSSKSKFEITQLVSKPSTSSIQEPAPGSEARLMSGIAILEKEVTLLGKALAEQNAATIFKQEVDKLVQELKINTNAVVDQPINLTVPMAAPKANVGKAPKKVVPLLPPAEQKAKPAVKVAEKNREPPKELFNPLINMFPDVDPIYISDLCINTATTKKDLESLVNILLAEGTFHPRVVNPEPEPQDINPDSQYENLQGIFPDAHPEYLREMAERYYNDAEAMKNFVQSKLENPDYPTMADYLKKIKITEQIRHYTIDFNAEKFLEIFPDPFKHFEDPKRVYRYNVIAFEFLKCHFRANKVATILKVYRHVNPPCHLSLAAKELEKLGPDMKSRRTDKLLPTEDIPLLQEIAFLQHKTEIREYMKEQTQKQKKEFKILKANNALVECQCCFDNECMPSNCLTCSEGHIFCKSCIKLGSATKIGDGQTQFPCFGDCKGEFTLPVLQKVLEPTTFSILLRKRQEEEVKAAGLEGLVSCPFCHFASIPPPEDKVFKCLNPECMKESCRLCKELNHVPLRCDEVTKGEEARRYLEEKMTEALVRKCYQCSRPFFKDEGCNKMTCPCGASTCYICGQRVKDYSHFNGQGSTRTDLCPLWSDNKVLNAQSVRIVAEAAEKEILKKNPHLKIDAKTLMPALPESSKGPHQDIANAHILPVHVRRA